MKFGDRLNNGATVLERRGDFVLCYWPGREEPYVVWRLTNEGDTISGYYTRDIVLAAKHLEEVGGAL